MTSSYGNQRPLSDKEELYLQNQALRAELQRRDGAKQGLREAVGGGLATGLGLGAVAAGAFGLASALSPAQRAKIGRNLSSTVDLSKQKGNLKNLTAKGIAAVEDIQKTVADVVRPSQPAPATSVERGQRIEETTRQARTEKLPKLLRDLPQPKTAIDPWTGRETITDPFGVPTVPAGPGIKERRFVFGDKIVRGKLETLIPEPTEEELAKVFSSRQERTYPSAPLTRKQAYELTAQKPDSEIAPVFKPQGAFDVDLITDPNTGEIFRRGKSPESFKETYISLRPELTGQRTDLPQTRTPGTFAEFSQEATALAEQATGAQAAAQSDFGPQQYMRQVGYKEAETLVDQQDLGAIGRIDQFANAANPAEDQATGRMKMALQRNEDNNLAAIEMAEDAVDAQIAKAAQGDPTVASVSELDSAINQVASTLPDGLPVDQAEGTVSATRFLESERAEIASQLGEQGLPISPSRIEAELGRRLGSEAYQYGPKYTQRKQALQLGATYDPKFFENIKTPSVQIAGETIPTASLREPVVMEETAQRLQERVAQKKDWLGNIRLQEQQKQIRLGNEIERLAQEDITLGKEIDSLLNIPKTFSSAEAARQASSQRALADVALDRQDIIDARINQLQKELFSSAARVSGAERSTQKQIQGLALPKKLKSGIEEGQRIFFEADELTGQPIPGTQELRSERRMVDMTPKGGGGRNVAEFTAGSRDEGIEIDLENILQQARTPQNQYGREYQKDQFGYRPGTGLTGKPLEGQPFTDDRTQTGRVITRTGIQKTGPQPGSMEAAVSPYTQLDDETLGMISLMGQGEDAINASRVLARRRREGFDPTTVTGPGQSQRVVSSVDLTPEQKQAKMRAIDVSRQITALQRSGRPDAQQLVQKYLEQLR